MIPITLNPPINPFVLNAKRKVFNAHPKIRESKKSLLVSVVVPCRKEFYNLPLLLERIDQAMKNEQYEYEIIILDDNSMDGSEDFIESVKDNYPVKFILKKGKAGKSFSLLEGIQASNGNIIAMIDADLQYPPEAIPSMIKELNNVDIVVANQSCPCTRRKHGHPSWYGK